MQAELRCLGGDDDYDDDVADDGYVCFCLDRFLLFLQIYTYL